MKRIFGVMMIVSFMATAAFAQAPANAPAAKICKDLKIEKNLVKAEIKAATDEKAEEAAIQKMKVLKEKSKKAGCKHKKQHKKAA